VIVALLGDMIKGTLCNSSSSSSGGGGDGGGDGGGGGGSSGKAVPLQAWTGPELRFLDFVTTPQDGGKVVSLMQRPLLPPVNTPGTHFC